MPKKLSKLEWLWSPLRVFPKNFLGIDIGTSSLKIVELSRRGKRIKLENYGEITAKALFEKPFRTFEKSTLTLSSSDIARAILAILEESKIKTRIACFSIPDFSSFFTWFNLPPLSKEELPQAIRYEARQHIPLSISEVSLDWQIIEGKISDKEKTPLKILLVAVPLEIVTQYQEIARLSRIQLQALEAEVFALSRSLLPKENAKITEKATVALIDIGAQSTTCSIVDKGILKRSHSFDIAGNQFTHAISKSLSIDYKTAETLKKKEGLLPSDKKIDKILLPLIDSILTEIWRIFQDFYRTEKKEVQKIILAGGSVLLPGLKKYFSEKLKKTVEIGDPFSDIYYPPILDEALKKIGPSYAIAVGVALRGLE